MCNLINNFINYVKNNEDCSYRTIVAYTSDLCQFKTFLLQKKITIDKDIKKISITDIDSFFSYLKQEGLKPSTRKRKSITIKRFFKYLEERLITNDITVNKMSKIKTEIREKKYLTKDNLIKFIEAFDNPRNKLLMIILVNTGLRISEALNLKISDIKDTEVSIIRKRNKEGGIYFNETCIVALRKYINNNKLNFSNNDYIFTNLHGKKLSECYIWQEVKKVCKKLNIADISTHSLRHTFATLQYEAGTDLKKIQAMLGHTDITTTARIYTHFNNDKLKESFNNNFLTNI